MTTSTEQCSCCRASSGVCNVASVNQVCRDGVVGPLSPCVNMQGTAATKVQCTCGDSATVLDPGQVCNYNGAKSDLVLDVCKGRCYWQAKDGVATAGEALSDVTSNKPSFITCKGTSTASNVWPYLWLPGAEAPAEGCACCLRGGTSCTPAKAGETCTFDASSRTVATLKACTVIDGTAVTLVDCECGSTIIKAGQVCNHENDKDKTIKICQHFPGRGGGKQVENENCACCESLGRSATLFGKDLVTCRVAGPSDVCANAETGASAPTAVLIKKNVADCTDIVVGGGEDQRRKVQVGKLTTVFLSSPLSN